MNLSSTFVASRRVEPERSPNITIYRLARSQRRSHALRVIRVDDRLGVIITQPLDQEYADTNLILTEMKLTMGGLSLREIAAIRAGDILRLTIGAKGVGPDQLQWSISRRCEAVA